MPQLKFSISLPVYNSGKYLESCLKSIYEQDYPKELIEILVVDGGSSDDTLEIAKAYNTRVFPNPKRLGEYGMQVAVQNASGDLLILFAADNGLAGRDWLKKAEAAFLGYKDLSCVWGKMIASDNDPVIMRYYELIQSEPLAHFLNKNLNAYLKKAETKIICGAEFKVFNVDPEKPLCWGANGIVYRLKDVKSIFLSEKYIGDNEIFQYMVEKGSSQVAYSFSLNIYHHTVSSIGHWVSKWKRNYTQIFLKTRGQRRIDWFYCGNFRLKMALWLAYSLVPVFSIVHSIYLSARDKNIYWMYHPLMCFLQTVTYLYWTIILPEGRKALAEHILNKHGQCIKK
ncbi:MAG: glycosyltransferase [Candidatus Omnitrophica bacterium]|nr:glycosyltransferase [Candidatus Omnitrophota bacterium]